MADEPGDPTPRPSDEGWHQPGAGTWWNESWYLDFVDPANGIGGYLRLGLYPNQGRAWYWACVVGPGRPLVTVIDHDVPLPRTGTHEIRTEGLWADLTVETPLDHLSAGLEAFAVGVDDPSEVYGDLRGDRVPLGFDLEWETDGTPYAYPGVTRYEVPCRVHGEVLVGRERFEIDGHGQRDHSWGERDWWTYGWSWTAGRLDDGTRFHGVDVDLGGAALYATGYVQPPGGPLAATDQVAHSLHQEAPGVPGSGTWRVADLDLRVEPIATSPVHLVSEDGRRSRFPRSWCEFTAADGRTGQGWTEWNLIERVGD
ncbi:MAG: hypothetical protein KDA94_05030 [Acidimicrobiales bacterium]|nr:hypothetical protein [Acidimicrobiales bacterium]